MHSPKPCARLVVAILVTLLLSPWVRSAFANQCAQARDIYRQGTTLLNYEQRRAAFRKAVSLCPSFAEARVNLADAYENLAKMSSTDVPRFNRLLDLAASQYTRATTLQRDLLPAHLGLGETLRIMGLYERSEKAYQQALRLMPGHPVAVRGLKKLRAIKAMESPGLRRSHEIVRHVKTASKKSGIGPLMGFSDEVVVKDRLRFNNILFDEWSHKLTRPEAIRQLKEIGEALASPELAQSAFIVEGHTDNRGGLDRNRKLSWNRADAVKQYLIDKFKIDASRISTQGFGYDRPRFPNDSPRNMLKNRRVELLFIDRTPGN